MALILSVQNGKLVCYDTNAGAQVGRWCFAPEIPDRCDNCIDPETLASYPAEGYTEQDWEDGLLRLRLGVCHRCRPDLCTEN